MKIPETLAARRALGSDGYVETSVAQVGSGPLPEPAVENPGSRSICICDSNPALAEGLGLILQADGFLSGFEITPFGHVDMAVIFEMLPDILIVNPWQTGVSRASALDVFADIPKQISVIAYCSDLSQSEVQQLISLGFRGIVPMTVRGEELVRIVSSVAFGGTYVSNFYQQNGNLSNPAFVAGLSATDVLTGREVDVLHRLALGSSMKEVAAALKISTKTVDTYKTRANRKLNLRTRADIVRYALDAGWLI